MVNHKSKIESPPFPWMTLLLFLATTALFCLVGVMAGWRGADRGLQIMPWVSEAVDYLGGFFADDLAKGRYIRLATGTLFFPTWLGFILTAAFIFWSMSKNVEQVCGPVSLLVAYVAGGAAGNALVAAAMHGEHVFLSPIGGVVFGLEGLLFGSMIRYRIFFPRDAFFNMVKGLAFWIGIICLLLFLALDAPWQYILDIPAGLVAGGICGLLFPVKRFEDESPVGGTVIKFLAFAAVIAALAAGFIQVARSEAPEITRFVPTWRNYENKKAGFTLPLPPGATMESEEADGTHTLTVKIKEISFWMGLFVRPTNRRPADAPVLAREHYEKRFLELRKKSGSISGLQFADTDKQMIGNEKGYMYGLVYDEMSEPDPDSGEHIHIRRREYYYVAVHGGRMYRFIFTYPDCAPGETDFNSDIRMQILRQFRFPRD